MLGLRDAGHGDAFLPGRCCNFLLTSVPFASFCPPSSHLSESKASLCDLQSVALSCSLSGGLRREVGHSLSGHHCHKLESLCKARSVQFWACFRLRTVGPEQLGFAVLGCGACLSGPCDVLASIPQAGEERYHVGAPTVTKSSPYRNHSNAQ